MIFNSRHDPCHAPSNQTSLGSVTRLYYELVHCTGAQYADNHYTMPEARTTKPSDNHYTRQTEYRLYVYKMYQRWMNF